MNLRAVIVVLGNYDNNQPSPQTVTIHVGLRTRGDFTPDDLQRPFLKQHFIST